MIFDHRYNRVIQSMESEYNSLLTFISDSKPASNLRRESDIESIQSPSRSAHGRAAALRIYNDSQLQKLNDKYLPMFFDYQSHIFDMYASALRPVLENRAESNRSQMTISKRGIHESEQKEQSISSELNEIRKQTQYFERHIRECKLRQQQLSGLLLQVEKQRKSLVYICVTLHFLQYVHYLCWVYIHCTL